jgi:GH24 family phage-related lysozyme (muramidase)
MYDSVRSNFISFTTGFEGSVPYMYLDVKGLVTTGIGNLIDPVGLALPLPFVRKSDSSPAPQSEITAEWNKIKAMTSLARQGANTAAGVTSLMLTADSITSLVLSKLDSNVATLKTTPAFSSFETWPADAQLGLLSMAWALGASFAASWPMFTAAVGQGDWSAAASNCQISTAGNPGVAPRNAADVQLFTNAAAVNAAGSDPTVLWYPKTAPAGDAGSGTGTGTDGGSTTTTTTTDGSTDDGTTAGGSASGSDAASDSAAGTGGPADQDNGSGSSDSVPTDSDPGN